LPDPEASLCLRSSGRDSRSDRWRGQCPRRRRRRLARSRQCRP
jgi:hypothetical protein